MNMIQFSEKLNKHKTKAEVFLLNEIREHFSNEISRFHFPFVKTQAIIGWYIVDFLFPSKHLIVELDGKQHEDLDNQTDDIIRDGYFKNLGFDILRYKNRDVFNNIEKILNYIELWACFENQIHNALYYGRKIKKQNELQNKKRLFRPSKSYAL